jgi:nitrogen fixation/metabolism regulation signal transduction histidine kinase
MNTIQLSKQRIQRIGLELFYSSDKEFDKNLEEIETEIDRLRAMVNEFNEISKRYPDKR